MNLIFCALLACCPLSEHHFKALWEEITPLKSELCVLAQERTKEIEDIKESWRPFIEKEIFTENFENYFKNDQQ